MAKKNQARTIGKKQHVTGPKLGVTRKMGSGMTTMSPPALMMPKGCC